MLYRMLHKLYKIVHRNYIRSLVGYDNRESKDTFLVNDGVQIMNPNVRVGKNVHLYNGVIIFGDGPVHIGDNTKIGFNTVIYANKDAGVYIGKNNSIAANAYIIDTNHSTKSAFEGVKKEDDSCEIVNIGDNVWIAAHCVIAKGSYLGNNVVIGANSFVNKAFPDNAIVAGSPAKIIKFRGEINGNSI